MYSTIHKNHCPDKARSIRPETESVNTHTNDHCYKYLPQRKFRAISVVAVTEDGGPLRGGGIHPAGNAVVVAGVHQRLCVCKV